MGLGKVFTCEKSHMCVCVWNHTKCLPKVVGQHGVMQGPCICLGDAIVGMVVLHLVDSYRLQTLACNSGSPLLKRIFAGMPSHGMCVDPHALSNKCAFAWS